MGSRIANTDTFQVRDVRGGVHRLREFTRFETGVVLGGGEVPTVVWYKLDNGVELEGLMGKEQFMDRRTGAGYTKV